MSKVTYAPMFGTVSGALTKINKKSPHAADQKMVLATHRKAPTKSDTCSHLYLRTLENVTRTAPVTTNEQANRNRFAAVSPQVQSRLKPSSNTYAADLAAFEAQKATGEPTFVSYLWKVCGDAYDQALANG